MKNRLYAAMVCFFLAGTCFAQGAATVMFASGSAQIVGKDGVARATVRGGELGAGETIETADGRVQLRFRDGANLSLQPATRFRVDEFRFAEQNGKASAEDRGFFSLLKGGFRTLTGLIGKHQREQYKVDAAVATIGIRGTDYSANLTDAGLAVSTFGGLVEVCSAAGCALVAPGETVFVPDRDSPPKRDGGRVGRADLSSEFAVPKPVELPPVTAPIQLPAASAGQGATSAATGYSTAPLMTSPGATVSGPAGR
ncbi:MAG: FecR family protein [Betaproteobacteria bacterium]